MIKGINLIGYFLLLQSFFFLHSVRSQANPRSTKGTDFWVSYVKHQSGGCSGLFVIISAENATTGTVSLPLQGWSQAYTIAANGSISIQIPSDPNNGPAAEPYISESIENIGVHIVSNDPVSVYSVNSNICGGGLSFPASADGTLILPSSALGTDYMVSTYASPGSTSDFWPEMVVLATKNNTIIEITPSVETYNGRPPLIPFNITLNAGQAYQIISRNAGDLTSTKVKTIGSTNPIALFAGAPVGFVPANIWDADHLYEQMPPNCLFGQQFITTPLAEGGDEAYRIMAKDNNTSVSINGATPITLNSGAWYETTLTNANYINTSKPVMVTQFAKGASSGNSGPLMQILQSNEKTTKKAIFKTINPSNYFSKYIANVVCKTTSVPNMKLNGADVSDSFTIVPAFPSYSYAIMRVSTGTHVLSCDSGFIGNFYAFGQEQSYGYTMGWDFIPRIADFTYDTAICINSPVKFTDNSEGPITSWKWDFGNGSTSNIQNPQYVYTIPGTYTVSLIVTKDCIIDTLSKTIVVNDLPVADAGDDVTITIGTKATLLGTGGGSYSWTPATHLNCDTCANPKANPKVTTTYLLTVTNSSGCISRDSVTVFVYVPIPPVPCTEIFIPNIFSPDNNGNNDLLCVFGNCMKSFHFAIYDRWGEKVFESDTEKDCWDGTYKGEPLNSAVFVYRLVATTNSGKEIVSKGNITLVR